MRFYFLIINAVFVFSIAFILHACSGGGNGGEGYSEIEQPDAETNTTLVQTRITLPNSSPLSLAQVSLEIYDESFSPDTDGKNSVIIPTKEAIDMTIMLPARELDSLPSVYLFTTLLPDETDVKINVEETAVSLLMNGINQYDLFNAGTPLEVKNVIRQKGAEFIEKFIEMIEEDPYALRIENLDNVYNNTYLSSLSLCKSVLKELTEKNMASSRALTRGVSGRLDVQPSNAIDDFIIHEDTGNLDWINFAGKMTGDIQIENDSMLFSSYKAFDMVSGELIKDIPDEFALRAFNPDIIGPQGGWSTMYWGSTGLYKADFQSVDFEIYTPGLVGSSWGEYLNSPSFPLAARTIFSGVLIPNIKLILPIPKSGTKSVLLFMNDYGIFDILFDKLGAGDFKRAAHDLFKKFTEKRFVTSLVEKVAKSFLKDGIDITVYVSKIFVKFAAGAQNVEAIGGAVDLVKLATDALSTHSKIKFKVVFPVALFDLTPTEIERMSEEDANPTITLKGVGFENFSFDGVNYSPKLLLETREYIEATKEFRPLTALYDLNDMEVKADGTEITFKLPYEWVKAGGKIIDGEIYVNLVHHFIDYNGVNEIVKVELPVASNEKRYKIDIVSDLVIDSFDKERVSSQEELIIYGKGFADSYVNNEVNIIDRNGKSNKAEVIIGNGTYLKVIATDDMTYGEATVSVTLLDRSVSNKKAIVIIPKRVMASPTDVTYQHEFENMVSVTLQHDESDNDSNCSVWYYLDNETQKKYNEERIDLSKSTDLYAFARGVVDGVNYDSATVKFIYYKCAQDEEFVDGECVENGNNNVSSMNFNLTSGMLSEMTIIKGSVTEAETTSVNVNGEVASTEEFNLTDYYFGLSISLPNLVTQTQRATVSGEFSMSPYSFQYESTNNLGDGHLYVYTDPRLTVCDKAEIYHDSCREVSGLNFTTSLTLDPQAYLDRYSWLSPNTEIYVEEFKFIYLTYNVERSPIGCCTTSSPDSRGVVFALNIFFNATILLPPE